MYKRQVYPQLADYIKKGILLGEIVDGEDMPSRRELALRLSINPNTVQKAYKLLEDEGFIRTISNIRSIAVVTQDTKERIRCQLIEQQVDVYKRQPQLLAHVFANTKVAAALQDNIAQLERYTLILGAITLLLACLMMITAFFRKKILHKKDIA